MELMNLPHQMKRNCIGSPRGYSLHNLVTTLAKGGV